MKKHGRGRRARRQPAPVDMRERVCRRSVAMCHRPTDRPTDHVDETNSSHMSSTNSCRRQNMLCLCVELRVTQRHDTDSRPSRTLSTRVRYRPAGVAAPTDSCRRARQRRTSPGAAPCRRLARRLRLRFLDFGVFFSLSFSFAYMTWARLIKDIPRNDDVTPPKCAPRSAERERERAQKTSTQRGRFACAYDGRTSQLSINALWSAG